MVIGLVGHIGSGKDTVAKMLAPFGYKRTAFADSLRAEVADAIVARSVPRSMPGDIVSGFIGMTQEEVWAKPTSERCRRLLQWWGNEYRRAQRSDYWIAKIRALMAEHPGSWVISDVRFPDEAALVREFGGVVWRVEREARNSPVGIPNHISERIARLMADVVIDNNSTFDALRRQIAGVLTSSASSTSRA